MSKSNVERIIGSGLSGKSLLLAKIYVCTA